MAGARAMKGSCVAMVVVVALLCATAVRAQAPPPAADCSVAFNNLQPCIEYVMANSSAPPSAPCCTAFAATQAQQPACLCQLQQAFADPATAPGNATRANAIPALCNVAVDYNMCPRLLGMAPAPAPATSMPTPSAPMMAPPAGAPATYAPTTSPSASPPATTPTATPSAGVAPSPKGSNYDCTNAFNLLTPCLTFVSGSGQGGPPKDCCSALGSVQSTEPVCLCQLLAQVANSSQYGVNATLATDLPMLCSVPADTSKCPALLGDAPAAAPTASTPSASPAASAPASGAMTPAASGPAGSTVDCSSEFASLQTCFTYVTANDTTPPPAECCTSLQTVVTDKPVCLCQLLQTIKSGDPAAQGINATRAMDLPGVCKVAADVNKCPALLGQPAAAAPTTAPPTPVGGVGEAPGAPAMAPAAPAGSGAWTFRPALSTATLLTTMAGFAALGLIF